MSATEVMSSSPVPATAASSMEVKETKEQMATREALMQKESADIQTAVSILNGTAAPELIAKVGALKADSKKKNKSKTAGTSGSTGSSATAGATAGAAGANKKSAEELLASKVGSISSRAGGKSLRRRLIKRLKERIAIDKDILDISREAFSIQKRMRGSTRRPSKSKKDKDDQKITNKYFLWKKEYSERNKAMLETIKDHRERAKILATIWATVSDAVKEDFSKRADENNKVVLAKREEEEKAREAARAARKAAGKTDESDEAAERKRKREARRAKLLEESEESEESVEQSESDSGSDDDSGDDSDEDNVKQRRRSKAKSSRGGKRRSSDDE